MSSTNPNSPSTDVKQVSNGGAGAPPGDPFKAMIKEAMEKVNICSKQRYPRSEPIIKMNLRYKPMDHITKAPHYFRYVPPVYSDSLNFDFDDHDYELIERDREFLKELNSKIVNGSITITSKVPSQTVTVKQEPLTEREFERFIDCADKVYQRTKNKVDQVFVGHFYVSADVDLR